MTNVPTSTRSWILTNKPSEAVQLSGPEPTFTLENRPVPSPLPSGTVLAKTLQLSNDPAQRGWIDKNMKPERLYVPPVQHGDIMRARSVLEIVAVGEGLKGNWTVGQKVMANGGWTDYAVVPEADLMAVPPLPGKLNTSVLLGSLGGTGLTAYYGLVQIARAQASDVVVVSGAAGATGSAVVQLAKHVIGCRKVIGIAGGAAKCAHVVEYLGADVCIDYRAPDFAAQLEKATSDYANVYFDNVGGNILSLMLTRMAQNGRIAACGSISTYNAPNSEPIDNWFDVITQRIEIKGFVIMDLFKNPAKTAEARNILVKAVTEGKLKADEKSETLVKAENGIEGVPKAWLKLFEGANTGKLVTVLDG